MVYTLTSTYTAEFKFNLSVPLSLIPWGEACYFKPIFWPKHVSEIKRETTPAWTVVFGVQSALCIRMWFLTSELPPSSFSSFLPVARSECSASILSSCYCWLIDYSSGSFYSRLISLSTWLTPIHLTGGPFII